MLLVRLPFLRSMIELGLQQTGLRPCLSCRDPLLHLHAWRYPGAELERTSWRHGARGQVCLRPDHTPCIGATTLPCISLVGEQPVFNLQEGHWPGSVCILDPSPNGWTYLSSIPIPWMAPTLRCWGRVTAGVSTRLLACLRSSYACRLRVQRAAQRSKHILLFQL